MKLPKIVDFAIRDDLGCRCRQTERHLCRVYGKMMWPEEEWQLPRHIHPLSMYPAAHNLVNGQQDQTEPDQVWQSQQFWEASFYQDVQRDIRALYLPRSEPNATFNSAEAIQMSKVEMSVLEIAAQQMRRWPSMSADQRLELEANEESTIYSQAIHYANRMVYLLVPLEAGERRRRERAVAGHGEHDSVSASVTNTSVADSERSGGDDESGFEEAIAGETGTAVVRFVSRFVDKVCNEGNVTPEHVRSLYQMIPGVVAMHLETLETVSREAQRLPPIQKPKILTPSLLNGERLLVEGLRVYLLPDGREESPNSAGLGLLPAEGALFLTNYRIIFKGTPCDPLVCEQTVVRAFPVTSLTKEKRISVQYLGHLDQWLQEGLQLRSNTFQMLKVAFDEEVNLDSVEQLRKYIHRVRHPPQPSVFHYFAFVGQTIVDATPIHKGKEKSATLKGMAKKTLLKTARQVGLKPKSANKRKKYILQPPGIIPVGGGSTSGSGSLLREEDELVMDESSARSLNPNGSVGGINLAQQPDPKTLERVIERSYCKDFQRLNLAPSPNTSGTLTPGKPKSDSFRISTANSNYSLCRTYPALVVVPAHLSDDSLARVARCYRHGRLPVITWRHPRTKGLLLRGASFHVKGVMNMLRSNANANSVATAPPGPNDPVSSSLEQERYLNAIITATPVAVLREGSSWAMSDSTLSITSLVLTVGNSAIGSASGVSPTGGLETPDVGRKSNYFGHGGTISKAMSTLRHNTGRKSVGLWGAAKDRRSGSGTATLAIPHSPHFRSSSGLGIAGAESDSASTTESTHSIRRAALYIFGEKTTIKAIRTDTLPKTDFIPVDFPEPRNVRNAFKKLVRACVPSSVSSEPDQSFYRAVENSEWLQQLQTLLQIAGAMVDLMDLNGSSVMLCLEEGWDVTAQLTSITQICLDPYYRTIDGFRVLIEKEWLAFGHRFSHRSHLNSNSPGSGSSSFTPIFLQFLDMIHQIHRQFPQSFEFNQFYLKFLAYHHVSCRFRSFLLDSEYDRADAGIMAIEDKRGSLSRHHRSFDTLTDDESSLFPNGGRILPGGSNSQSSATSAGQSIFDYIEKQSAKSPIFHNFCYTSESDNLVLRPYCTVSNLVLWDYFLTEELSYGSPYDLEVNAMDLAQAEEARAMEGPSIPPSRRRAVKMGYDGVQHHLPDVFSYMLDEIRRLETELGHLPQKWKLLWDRMEPPSQDFPASRQEVSSVAMARAHARDVHKRQTMEILLKGRFPGGSGAGAGAGVGMEGVAQVYTNPHRFEKYNFSSPTSCDFCSTILWGIVKTGMRCNDCGYNCHEKCIDLVPKHCSKYQTSSIGLGGGTDQHRVGPSTPTVSQSGRPGSVDVSSVGSNVSPHTSTSHQHYDQFSPNIAENRTHEGYLYKRGALLKAWKQRWFVLDSVKHQLRYYDSMEDPCCKGFVDLADVVSVAPSGSVPQGAPKKFDEKTLFEVRTQRRTYNFCANDSASAQEWIEKIQACLQ
uniref:SET domain binding factor n=1 Tax=Daphnia magna TaxID=35525 RepID=A0A0P5TBM6_9CRUS